MTTGRQIAITFKMSTSFASNLDPLLSMITFGKNITIFLIVTFFECHMKKNGRFYKIKK